MKISYRKIYIRDLIPLYQLLNHPLIIKQLPYQESLTFLQISMLFFRLFFEKFCYIDHHMMIIADHHLIGLITLKRSLYSDNNSISFELDPRYWRRGIMSKALTYFCQNLFKKYKDFNIYAYVSVSNQRSLNVLENCGFMAIEKQYCYFNNRCNQIPVYKFKKSHHE